MADYQLELRQIVDYPRCRIYREFMQTLIADRSIRTGGCSGLFYYVVLCSYANFRTSYRRIDRISYTVYPGEWVCSIADVTEWFRVRFHYCGPHQCAAARKWRCCTARQRQAHAGGAGTSRRDGCAYRLFSHKTEWWKIQYRHGLSLHGRKYPSHRRLGAV